MMKLLSHIARIFFVARRQLPEFTMYVICTHSQWYAHLMRIINSLDVAIFDRLCGLVVRVPGYRSRGPGSISGTTKFYEKQ
jgi:hypothetical protein